MSDIRRLIDMVSDIRSDKMLSEGSQSVHFRKKRNLEEGSEELVQIEYWQQDTVESGRWVKTKPMPRATAEKIVGSFDRGEIVDVEQGVAEGRDPELDRQAQEVAAKLITPKNIEKLNAMAYDSTIYRSLDRYFEKHNIPETIYNRVAHIVFKALDDAGRRMSTDPRLNQDVTEAITGTHYHLYVDNKYIKTFFEVDSAKKARDKVIAKDPTKTVKIIKELCGPPPMPAKRRSIVPEQVVAEGIAGDDRPKYKLHTELVYNHGADRLKLQYERDGDANKLIANIKKIAKLKHGMSISTATAKWIAKDLVYPDILMEGVAEGQTEKLDEVNPYLVQQGLETVIDFLSKYPTATTLTAGAVGAIAGGAIVKKLVTRAWKNHKELKELEKDVLNWSHQKLNANKNVGRLGGKVAKIIQKEIQRRKQNLPEQDVAETTGNPGMPHDFTAVQPGAEVWYKGRFAGWTTGKVYDDPYGKAGKMVAFEPNSSEFPGDEGRILSLPYSEVSLRKLTSIDKLKGPEQDVAEDSEEQVYKVVALDKSNALKKPTKLNVKASSIEDVFSRLAANDWYALSINGVEVVGGKRLKQDVAEGWDSDTTRLEQDVRYALENGDDYTAKQYAKMAPTPEAKKYLLNIIKQEMYGTEPGQGGVMEGIVDDMPADLMVSIMNRIRRDSDTQRYQHLQKLLKRSKNSKTIAQIKALIAKEFPQNVAEDLDANQRRVGQLGPTEKIGKRGTIGRLVGGN